ncbi:MAG: hypothetical protein NE328_13590 [Lentisphaeraceae bacterium]|nr:hypothetical protein [Lentisphaeraceae bacterium]
MAKFRAWYGDDPTYKKVSSLAEAIKFIKKNPDFDESNSGVEEKIDGDWDEWLDEDDQNVHEHLYMYGGKSKFLKVDEDEDDDDEDLEDLDEDDEDEEVEEVEEVEDDVVDEDLDDRLLDVIGGGRAVTKDVDEEIEVDDDDDLLDDDDDDDLEDEDLDDDEDV